MGDKSIFEELSAASGITTPTIGETEQQFLTRLLAAIATISEEAWNKLSDPAGDWFNAAAGVVSGNNPCPPCPGLIFSGSTNEVAPDQAGVPASATTAAQPDKKRGVMARARELAILNQGWDWRQVLTQILNEGYATASGNSVWVSHAEVHNVLKTMVKLGYTVVPPTA